MSGKQILSHFKTQRIFEFPFLLVLQFGPRHPRTLILSRISRTNQATEFQQVTNFRSQNDHEKCCPYSGAKFDNVEAVVRNVNLLAITLKIEETHPAPPQDLKNYNFLAIFVIISEPQIPQRLPLYSLF